MFGRVARLVPRRALVVPRRGYARGRREKEENVFVKELQDLVDKELENAKFQETMPTQSGLGLEKLAVKMETDADKWEPSTEAEPYNLPWEDEDEDAEAQEDNDDDEYEYVEVDADEEIDGEVVDEDPTDGEMQRTLEPYLPLPPPLLPRLNRLEDLPPNFTEEQYAAAIVHGKSIHKPFLHDAPLRYPVAQLHFRSHHPGYLELFCHFAESAASALGIPTSGGYVLPTKRSVWTVPKSPFIYKTSQENFERRVWKRGIKAWDADEEVVKKWVEYLRKHAMGGVGMRVARWERVKLGHGAKVLENVKKQLGTGERERRIKNVAEWKSDA